MDEEHGHNARTEMTHRFFEPIKHFVSTGELVYGLKRAFRNEKTTHGAVVNAATCR